VATVAALIAISTAQLADLATFLEMVEAGGLESEANPIVAHLARTAGLDVVVGAKLGLIGFVTMTFAIVAPVRQRLAASVLTLATASGLLGATTNLLTIA
jgi:hypothetical protein